mmetsp:Transcript_18225/g.2960  ORF Transcript_18225/g.2960 Transcript_18225/m.2960 type:complete len:87 (+) Transcript_18225:226-486(+)
MPALLALGRMYRIVLYVNPLIVGISKEIVHWGARLESLMMEEFARLVILCVISAMGKAPGTVLIVKRGCIGDLMEFVILRVVVMII